MARIGRRNIAALEIGTEPELYSGFPWYHTRASLPAFGRPLTYTSRPTRRRREIRLTPACPRCSPSLLRSP